MEWGLILEKVESSKDVMVRIGVDRLGQDNSRIGRIRLDTTGKT